MTAPQTKRSLTLGISALISGAGIGGLMSALELWRAGCDVRILERTERSLTTGDSFTISPTALNAFAHWPAMLLRASEIAYYPKIAYHRHTGEHIAGPFGVSEILSTAIAAEKRPKSIPRHSRPKFHAMLLEQLARIGVRVECGAEVVEYFDDEQAGRAGVVLRGRERVEADLVVAADGVHGQSWGLVAGKPVPARSSGRAAFRTAFPVGLAVRDPVVAERFRMEEDGTSVMEMWAGPGMHAFFWRNEDEMIYLIDHEDAGTAAESWSHRVGPEEVLKFTSTIPDWPEAADRVIEATPSDQLVGWKLMWRDPQPEWTSPGGRVVQLGDAAHTFLPSSGQGGTQAMEDAISLATCIRLACSSAQPSAAKARIPNATRVHNLLRFERVSCLQGFGIRNAENRDSSKKGKDTDKAMQLKVGRWIMEHDPESYAEENFDAALAHLEKGTEFKNTNIPPGMEYRPWTIDGLLESFKEGEKTIFDGDWS